MVPVRLVSALIPLVVMGCGYKRPADVRSDDAATGDDSATDATADAGLPYTALTCEDTSGTRLKATYQVMQDGSRLPVGLTDTTTAKRCTYHQMTDGMWHCVPAEDIDFGYVGYTAGCVTPILAAFAHTPGNLFVADEGGWLVTSFNFRRQCGGATRVFEVGAQLSTPATIYLKDPSDGSCLPMNNPSPSFKYYAAGTESPPSAFVAATLGTAGSGRVSHDFYTGQDGSRGCANHGYFHDHDAGVADAACTPARSYDDTWRCMPFGIQTKSRSISAACSPAEQGVVVPSCASNLTPGYVGEYQTTACGQNVSRMKLIGGAQSGYYYLNYTNACTAVAAPWTAKMLGASFVPESTFAPVTFELVVSGGSRMQRQDQVFGGLRAASGVWFDSTLDTNCRITNLASGTLACAPESSETRQVASVFGTVHTSASCDAGSKVNYAFVPPPTINPACVPPQAPVKYATVYDGVATSYYRVGNVVSSAGLYTKSLNGVDCDSVPTAWTVYEVGASVEGELATVTVVAP
jgi:hypothetical protein